MSSSNPLPHLLVLLDDPSDVVRSEVRKALERLAADLPELLGQFGATDRHRALITDILFEWRKTHLLRRWQSWRNSQDPAQELENAQLLLSEFQFGWRDPIGLLQRLDGLSARFPVQDEAALALPGWLFSAQLKGNTDDYYAPANSFVSEVIRHGRGNPISLATTLILVGKRLGIRYWGCNFPAHFLATLPAATPAETRYIDCFDGGKIYTSELTPEMRGELSAREIRGILAQPVDSDQIISRMLRNLVSSYLQLEQRAESNLYTLLLKDVSARAAGLGQGVALREPLYCPGQLVQHKDKGYRGVVVDYDLYQLHASGQPHQPTYRVLVHGSPQVATAWEEQLQSDRGGLVAHPFVSVFFSRFENGMYLRNSRPWEGG